MKGSVFMPFKRKLVDCYIDPKDSTTKFYKLDERLPCEFVCERGESSTQSQERWETETHWLADWDGLITFSDYKTGCVAEFDISSSSYLRKMYHDGVNIGSVRNLNIKTVKIIG